MTGCDRPGGGGGGTGGALETTTRVTLAAAEMRPVEKTLPVLGSLLAIDRADLSVKITGRLREIRVDVGSRVRQGDVLATLERRDFELGLQQAAAQLAQARARLGLPIEGEDDTVDLQKVSVVREARARLDEALANRDRVRRLRTEGISSDAELDSAEAQYEVAVNRHQDALQDGRERAALLAQRRAEFEIARQRLVDTELRAPYDGIIQSRMAGAGEFVAGGSPVVSIVRVEPLRLRMEVPERLAGEVRTGQVARATLAGDTRNHAGRVVRISPALDERNRMLIVEAELPNPGDLRPGAFARCEIVVSESRRALVVPEDAVTVFAGIEKVAVAAEGQAKVIPVTTGRRQDGWVEIVSGLDVGALVIRNPGGLQSGDRVEPAMIGAAEDAGGT